VQRPRQRLPSFNGHLAAHLRTSFIRLKHRYWQSDTRPPAYERTSRLCTDHDQCPNLSKSVARPSRPNGVQNPGSPHDCSDAAIRRHPAPSPMLPYHYVTGSAAAALSRPPFCGGAWASGNSPPGFAYHRYRR
jgi:hypothetical protein